MKDDLIVKLAAVAGGVLLLGWLANRAAGAVGNAAGALGNMAGAAWGSAAQGLSAAGDFVGTQAATTFNPASDQNFVYRGVNGMGSSLTGDQHFTLGGWLYDVTHPEPKPYTSGGGGQFNGHGASGGWGDPYPSPPDYGIYF